MSDDPQVPDYPTEADLAFAGKHTANASTSRRMRWTEGNPRDACAVGWIWIVNEEGDYAVVEIDYDGLFSRPKGFRTITAWAGPIEPPEESTLP